MRRDPSGLRLTRLARRPFALLALLGLPDVISFAGGFPDPETFPRERISSLLQEFVEGGELGAFQYELIIERTRSAGLHGRVTISHGFALGELPAYRQEELLDRLGEAGISWATVAARTGCGPW